MGSDVAVAAPAEAAPTHVSTWRYQPALDGLRAVAVLGVIAYHDGVAPLSGGFLGVDVFFVLSGFLITSLLVDGWHAGRRIDLRAFWSRRARRLLPALFLLLTAVAVYGAVAGGLPPNPSSFRSDGLSSLFYVANWRFISTSHLPFASLSPFRHLWSLAIEEQFYLVWLLVVAACLAAARGSHRLLVGVCITGIVVSAGLSALLYETSGVSRVYYGTDARAHQLLIGALLALLLVRWSPGTRRSLAATHVVGLAGVGVCAWAFQSFGRASGAYYCGLSTLLAVAVAAVIASAVQPRRHNMLRSVLSGDLLRWIGRMSYGLYLWDWPVDVYFSRATTGLHGWTLDVGRLAITFALASISYYALERPVRQGRVGTALVRIGAVVGVAAAALALVIATVGRAHA